MVVLLTAAAELEHLTCFAGAMLGLGAKLLDRPEDLDYGKKVTQTCYWMVSYLFVHAVSRCS